MTPNDERRLHHILEQIARIKSYTTDGRSAFDKEPMAQDAVLHCLTVIGEAAGALADHAYRQVPALPPRGARGQRNIIVHEYWRIDPDIIWATISNDLPLVKVQIEALLKNTGHR